MKLTIKLNDSIYTIKFLNFNGKNSFFSVFFFLILENFYLLNSFFILI